MNKEYRECMDEIIGILKKYDMAGAITVVSKERAMFRYHFPAWTCVELSNNHVRLRMKASEHANPKKVAKLTAHAIMQMRDCAKNTINLTEYLGKIMTDKWGMEHTPNVDFDPEDE